MKKTSFYWVVVGLFVVCIAARLGADIVQLSTGEVLRGDIVEQTDATYVLDHPVLGRLTIPRDQVAKLEVQPKEAAPAEEGEQPADVPLPKRARYEAKPPPPPKVPPSYDSILEGWKSTLSLSFSGSSGNTDRSDLRFGFDTKRETLSSRAFFKSALYMATDDGDKTSEEFFADGRIEWPIDGSRWFAFIESRYDYDRFQAWDHRYNGAAGLGYELIKEDDILLKVRGGAGAAREWGGTDDHWRPEALAAVNFDWKINGTVSLTANTTYYPDLEEFPESRILSDAGVVLKLSNDHNLSLKFGIENEYQSRTDDDSKHNDFKYFGSLLFTF